MLPDLNSINDFLSILKRKVEQRNPYSKEQLKKVDIRDKKKIGISE